MEFHSNPSCTSSLKPSDGTDQCTSVTSPTKGKSKNSKRNTKQVLLPERNHAAENNYPRFYKISSVSGESLAEIDVIKANRQLESTIRGRPKKITELRTGQLLVEVATELQSHHISSLKTLDKCAVTVEAHDRLNQSKGTIRYANRPNYTDTQLLEALKPFGVSEVYQLKRKENGTLITLPIFILTFNSYTLPDHVNIGWTRCPVRPYVPRPRRCFNCQRFGHGARSCRSSHPICVNCGEVRHEEICSRPV